MQISCDVVECQHPIGPHVHVLTPSNEKIAVRLMVMFGIDEEIFEEIELLSRLEQKVTKVATMQIPTNPESGQEIFVVYNLTVDQDKRPTIKAIFLKIDSEFNLMPPVQLAEMFRQGIK